MAKSLYPKGIFFSTTRKVNSTANLDSVTNSYDTFIIYQLTGEAALS